MKVRLFADPPTLVFNLIAYPPSFDPALAPIDFIAVLPVWRTIRGPVADAAV
jgi:hypothetical protein